MKKRKLHHDARPPIGSRTLVALRISDACRLIGIRRTELAKLIDSDALDVVEMGSTTLLAVSSLEALIDEAASRTSSMETSTSGAAPPHPIIVNAILTCSILETPDEVRRDFASTNKPLRSEAEEAMVDQITEALFGKDLVLKRMDAS